MGHQLKQPGTGRKLHEFRTVVQNKTVAYNVGTISYPKPGTLIPGLNILATLSTLPGHLINSCIQKTTTKWKEKCRLFDFRQRFTLGL